MCRIITTPIEDFIFDLNKHDDRQKKQKKPSTSFEEELQKAEKEIEDERKVFSHSVQKQ